jgi:glycosyltransferase involved in cell wall biosynthesis
MKILFISNVFPNSLQPGRGTFNRAMLQALGELHQTYVVSPVSWVEEFGDLIKQRSRLDQNWLPYEDANGMRVDYPRFYYPPKMLHQHYGQFMYWSIRPTLNKAISRFQPDVILSYWVHPDGEVAVRAAREHGIPAVVMTGGSDVLLLTRNRHRRRAIQSVLQQSDAVITVSQDIQAAVQQLQVHPEKIQTVYRGVDRSRFQPGDRRDARERLGLDPDQRIIVSVGRLEPVKGHGVLLEACAKISKQGSPFTCYVLGNGSLHSSLSQKVREYGLDRSFQLAGSQPQSRLADWYRAADVIALPSLSEGVPNVLLEAISCGGRFVASRVGGIPEIADPDWDRLVSPENPDELAEALTELLGAPTPAEQRIFEPMTWQESAVQLSQILSDCCTQYSCGLTEQQKTRSSYRRKNKKLTQPA